VDVRRATASDADAIASLLHVAFQEFERVYTRAGYAATTPDAERIRERLAEGPIWVAHGGDGIVGTVAAVERADGAYVRSLAVAPAARGHRAGLQLMRELERFARDRRAARMYLSTTPFLFSAIRLYERLGFRRTGEPPDDIFGTPLLTMARRIGSDGGRRIPRSTMEVTPP
jgi:ribosomal protein S18 acetylase RimI-like enzyme